MQPRQGVIAALPRNIVALYSSPTQKQTEGGCQNEDSIKHGPNERTEQNSRKRTKQNGNKQSIRCRVQTLVIQMPKELIVYFNSIQKTQAEMKVTLNRIKKNLQGTNSEGDKAENPTNDLEHKEEKSIQSEQQEEKRIKKNEDRLGASGTSSNVLTFKS